MYALSQARPQLVRKLVLKGAERHLGGTSDLGNFSPRYDPWDQRMCIVPDANLFRAIRDGDADVVTDTVDTFTETGVRLGSGTEIAADIVVVATGLQVQMLGGASMSVDGAHVALNERVTYKAVLVEGVPNAAVVFGYTNASWTLKADLAANYVCRLLNHMSRHGYTRFVVHASAADRGSDSVLGSLNAGYVRRGNDAAAASGHCRRVAHPQQLLPRPPDAAPSAGRRRRAPVQLDPGRIDRGTTADDRLTLGPDTVQRCSRMWWTPA